MIPWIANTRTVADGEVYVPRKMYLCVHCQVFGTGDVCWCCGLDDELTRDAVQLVGAWGSKHPAGRLQDILEMDLDDA